ncbi:MAG: TIR domain-containing protein [Cellulomonadaceae bacterium]|nr:TIR domain-containing protein [Cellulomonadaceae bacterium]
MALHARERFSLADRVIASFEQDTARWNQARMHLLFQQFELPLPFDSDYESRTEAAARILGDSGDGTLTGLATVVLDLPDESVRDLATTGVDTGLWKDGYVRVFLSHSAVERVFVGEVSRELAVFGVHGFVAHDSMEEEKSWQPQIEVALRTAEAFVALVHPPFNDSAWCQQEVGWAQGRALASYFIRFGADPRGFPSPTQWPSRLGRTAREVAVLIVNWVERQGIASTSILDALLDGLAGASNYYDAEAAAKQVVELGDLSDAAWDRLGTIYWENDQVSHGILANRTLKPFYEAHDREFPPLVP